MTTKILSQRSSIIQQGTSRTISLVTPERMPVYCLTLKTNLRGDKHRKNKFLRRVIVRNMTSRLGGGLSRESWEL